MKFKDLRNSLRQRGVYLQRDLCLRIEENPTRYWKKYVAKQYKDGKLIASYPADKLSEIDLTFFVK